MNKKTIPILVALVILFGGGVLFLQNRTLPIEGVTLQPTEVDTLTVTVQDENGNPVEVDVSDWQIYRNEELGFQFRFPQGFEMEINLPDESLTEDGVLLGFRVLKKGTLERSRGFGGAVKTGLNEVEKQLYNGYKLGNDERVTKYAVYTISGKSVSVWNDKSLGTINRVVFSNSEIIVRFSDNVNPQVMFQAISSTFEFVEI